MKHTNPAIELSIGMVLITIVLCFASASLWFCGLVTASAVVLALRSGQPSRKILTRLAAPYIFISLTAATLLITIRYTPHHSLPVQVSWTPEQLPQALLVALKSGAMVSTVVAAGFYTTFSQTMALASRCRVPELLIDVLVHAHSAMITIARHVATTRMAQHSRLGYSTARPDYASFKLLMAAVFSRSIHQIDRQHQALQARTPGTVKWFFAPAPPLQKKEIIIAIATASMLLTLFILLP